MGAAPRIDSLERAVDLILQPLLVEAMVAIGERHALEDAFPTDVDGDQLGAAVYRLIMIGAIEPSSGRLLGHYTPTTHGTRLLQLLDDLDAAIARSEMITHG